MATRKGTYLYNPRTGRWSLPKPKAPPQWLTPERKKHMVDLFYKSAYQSLIAHTESLGETALANQLRAMSPSDVADLMAVHGRTLPGGFCVFGDANCQVERHHYENFVNDMIDEWKADDREERSLARKAEERSLHHGDAGRFGKRFDPVAREAFMADQPPYYLEGLGVNALTLKATAKIRLPSSNIRFFVDVSQPVKGLSKNKRRKIRRYGAATPVGKFGTVHDKCQAAIRDFWKR